MTTNTGNEELLADYLGEAHDYLERINQVLLELTEGDGGWPTDRVNDLFRDAHSLKGLSACFGFEATSRLTHELETVLTRVRDGLLAPDPGLVRTVFAALDLVAHLTAEIAAGGSEQTAVDGMLAELATLGSPDRVGRCIGPGNRAAGGGAKSGAGASAGAPKKAAAENETVRVRMDRLDALVNLTGELVIARSRFQLVARQLRPLQRLHELGADVRDLRSAGHDLRAQLAQLDLDAATLRTVDLLVALGDKVATEHEQFGAVQRCVKDLDAAAYDLDGVVSGIHEAVLQVRMVPLDTVFRRLQRVVRDTAEAVGKEVDLEIVGGDTQIDKRVADELVNPLVHILRNAVDHGLEATADRRAAGKPPRGRIVVEGAQRGSSVWIGVRDDGRGIDAARVVQKAVEKGLLTSEQAATIGEAEAQRLIFAPGFSTAQRITEVSGRGMGMDIVEAAVKGLRGSLQLQSQVGVGTTFGIQLPPSMSILSSLLVAVQGTTFSLPLTEVREIVELRTLACHSVQGRRTILVRDQALPLVGLPEIYRFLVPAAPAAGSAPAAFAVVFGNPGQEIALAVDALLGKEDLVIKPLCAELAAVRGLAGMAIRGDGEVTLILDPTGFAEHAARRHTLRGTG
jgi:chemotaxis protein histidine kinase CheA